MDGYDASTYGDRFADVYDDWYGSLTDTAACTAAVATLAQRPSTSGAHGPADGEDGDGEGHVPVDGDDEEPADVLELGVGTGRLAIPLAAQGLRVTGVDASAAMLGALAAKPGGADVEAVLGDMASPPLGDRRWRVVLIAYNTLFNLVDPGDQQRCLAWVAEHLTADGCAVVEAFVPEPGGDTRPVGTVEPREVTADKVVLSVSRVDPSSQEVLGQYVDITESGIRLRPWHIRWATPAQLDAMAEVAGLVLVERWAGWERAPFDDEATTHVSLYRRAT